MKAYEKAAEEYALGEVDTSHKVDFIAGVQWCLAQLRSETYKPGTHPDFRAAPDWVDWLEREDS